MPRRKNPSDDDRDAEVRAFLASERRVRDVSSEGRRHVYGGMKGGNAHLRRRHGVRGVAESIAAQDDLEDEIRFARDYEEAQGEYYRRHGKEWRRNPATTATDYRGYGLAIGDVVEYMERDVHARAKPNLVSIGTVVEIREGVGHEWDRAEVTVRTLKDGRIVFEARQLRRV